MSRLTRRTLLRSTGAAAGIATFGILTRRGDAAEFVFRYANNNVAAHPMNVRLREAAEGITSNSHFGEEHDFEGV
jgi:TRAP-type transport system periplasmic protein